MPDDRFAGNDLQPAAKPLTVFRAELLGSDQATWPELLAGFDELKAITFSSSLEFLLRLAGGFSDLEIVFGSESVLSREHLTLAQASQTVQAYGFVDALADQKALVEALARLLGRTGQALLNRVAAGSLRFRLLRGKPSHEKLYLLSGAMGQRVVTGSANLSLAAFEGRQHEIIVAFEGKAAWDEFDRYYERDWGCSLPSSRMRWSLPAPTDRVVRARRRWRWKRCRSYARSRPAWPSWTRRRGRCRRGLPRRRCGRPPRWAPN